MQTLREFGDRTLSIPLVVPLSWVDRLNAAARAQGISRSDLIRQAIEQVVFSEDKAPIGAGKGV